MSSEPGVSVVTPVYNGEGHLGACVESVLAQRYRNWDYTIINNRSRDGTLAIAQEYAARDARIRVVDNRSFLSVIANHNAAFRQVSPGSRYCKLVAADDTLHPDCLREMVRVAESDSDIPIVGTCAWDGTDIRYRGVPEDREVVSGREVGRRNLLGGPYVFGVPSTLLYRADVVRGRDPFLSEDNVHADMEVCFELLADLKFGFVHRVLVDLGVRAGSTSSFAARMDSYRAGWLRVLVRYGDRYLEPDELEAVLERHVRSYRRFLGDELFKGRDREFWAFHRSRLAELGYPISRLELARQAVRFTWDRVFRHPLRTARNLHRRLGG